VLAVEAGKTVLLDRDAVVDFADRYKLIVVAITPGAQDQSRES
jgi:DUF1009 family protein